MSRKRIYANRYEKSWAIVVGINEYESAGTLSFAVNDAEAISSILTDRFDFPEANVSILLDEKATRDNILDSFQTLAQKVGADDRVLFFFAGHGHTKPGNNGDVGFLVPVEGRPGIPRTLIRWGELTQEAEFLPSKHVLFIMDACYSGLAFRRSSPGGRNRFLQDLLGRYVRQALTAGKADQTVSDSGGPRTGNSVFTGHLLEALEGKAATEEGIISASAVMAYVRDHVGQDPDSEQTPHFGALDGEGDFLFALPAEEKYSDSETRGRDILVPTPKESHGPERELDERDLVISMKDLLSEPNKRIHLEELVMHEISALKREVEDEKFRLPSSGVTGEHFAVFLEDYGIASKRVMIAMALMGKWCRSENRSILQSAVVRLADINYKAGNVLDVGMRWHPVLLSYYCCGMGAIAGGEYGNLSAMLTAKVGAKTTGDIPKPFLLPAIRAGLDVLRTRAFKLLPGHERQFVPQSEYLFKFLQPTLDDTLFLGSEYEDYFDQFEVLRALIYLDLDNQKQMPWAPLGRFAWKYGHHHEGALAEVEKEFLASGDHWPPLVAGLFNADKERASKAIETLKAFVLQQSWY